MGGYYTLVYGITSRGRTLHTHGFTSLHGLNTGVTLTGVTLGAELSDVPMEELQRIRLKIGTKKFDSALKTSLVERRKKHFKRANKNRQVHN